MKKYIVWILFLFLLISFSEAKNYASWTGEEWECTDICQWVSYDPKSNWCNSECCETNNLLTYSGWNSICCDSWEVLNPKWNCSEPCDWEFYGRWWFSAGANKCCPSPWIVYDKDSVTNNFAKCCQWIVYGKDIAPESVAWLSPSEDNSLLCCANWNIVAKNSNWQYNCMSCSSLKSEVKSFVEPYSEEQQEKINTYQNKCSNAVWCPDTQIYKDEVWVNQCCDWLVQNGKCLVNNEWSMWIEMDQDCLINGQCKFSIYDTLGIRQSLPKETRSSPWIFIQDIILSATFFVGTVMTAVLIISGLLFVLSWFNADLHSKAKKWVIWSLVWLLFVSWSYAFVRLIQFLVTWGGG